MCIHRDVAIRACGLMRRTSRVSLLIVDDWGHSTAIPAPNAKSYTSKSLNSGLLLMTARTNPHSGSTFRLRRRTS
jgi:hypothetical protein